MTASKPPLLYLSPVVPAVTGNGLAMRAGTVLRALAEHHSISLLIVRLYAPFDTPVPVEIADLCRQVAVVPASLDAPRPSSLIPRPWRRLFRRCSPVGPLPASDLAEPARQVFRDVPFDVVHVFRLAMLRFARPYLGVSGRRPLRDLDLDDVESITRRRLAQLYRQNGNEPMARFEELEAELAEAVEAEVLRDFDRVYVCSELDRERLRGRSRARVCVLPNALPVPNPLPPRRTDGPFTFLFVGTLGYYPNEDGIVRFCTEVLPRLRRAAPRAFRLVVVGSGVTPAVEQLDGLPEVRVVGAVPNVAPWYREADAIVVPVRAGGGTRIKVLEAFSYRRPVVATSIGIEGIDVQADEHVLVGDTPTELAEHCLRLMIDPRLGKRLADRAFSLFRRAYTTEALARTVAGLS
jgi:polysaccharide biosynthesis protein PslH